ADADFLDLLDSLLDNYNYRGNSYGVEGSEFSECVECGADNGVGVLRHPFKHADGCSVPQNEAKFSALRQAAADLLARRECHANCCDFNRRVSVEQRLLDAASGKKPLPTREECRELAMKLGVPELSRA